MQWYLVIIFVLVLLAVLIIFHDIGFFKIEENMKVTEIKEEKNQETIDESPIIKDEKNQEPEDIYSIYCELFKVSAKFSFIYKDDNKSTIHSVMISSIGRENGLFVIEGYSEKTNKQERFWESHISGCVDTETGRKIGDLVSFLMLHKDRVKRLPPPTAVSIAKPGIEMRIRYTSWSIGEMVERRVRAIGLGRFRNKYYVIAYSNRHNERRTYQVVKFRNCIRLDTGEKIPKIKEFMLAYNPFIEDLTDEFERFSMQREREFDDFD